MHELQAIVDAHVGACRRGERTALATVVDVVGSAYRRPGAKMLVTETGNTFGSISGGCLERDVAERAAQVIASGEPTIIEYDTRGDEDIVWGLGLGCNGVVKVLLESANEGSSAARAIQFIDDCLRQRKSGLIATVIEAPQAANLRRKNKVGEKDLRLLFEADLSCRDPLTDSLLNAQICADARKVMRGNKAILQPYETAGGQTEVFFDVVIPPRSLVIFGAEHDALPVMKLAQSVGWHTTVVDTKARRATTDRFNQADQVLLCRAENIAGQISLSSATAVVIMTHNYLDDVELLKTLLHSPVCYLGILGPKQRTMKLLTELRVNGNAASAFRPANPGNPVNLARLHSPIGLDIGAETPEEIALAILAEIQASCADHSAGFLRDRQTAIHQDQTAKAAASAALTHRTPASREIAVKITCLTS